MNDIIDIKDDYKSLDKCNCKIEIVDRYTDIGYPDLETMCKGQCEGLGVVPIQKNDFSEPWHTLYLELEKINPSNDGTQFVKCPECNGTGKRIDC